MKPKDRAQGLTMIFGTIAVFLLVVFGVGQLLGLFWHGPTVALCEGRVMPKYETCEEFIDSGNASRSYDQRLHEQWIEHDFYLYGVAFLIVAALTYVAARLYFNPPVRRRPKHR